MYCALAEPVARPSGELRTVEQAELGQHVPDVGLNGPHRQTEPTSDLLVGEALCHQARHLLFAPAQPADRGPAGCGGPEGERDGLVAVETEPLLPQRGRVGADRRRHSVTTSRSRARPINAVGGIGRPGSEESAATLTVLFTSAPTNAISHLRVQGCLMGARAGQPSCCLARWGYG